jgi:hypothetical protein
MIKFQLFLLQLFPFALQGATEGTYGSSGRYLEETYDDDVSNGGGKVDEMKEWSNAQWGNASARVNDDLNGMWSTTPQEWGDEYWEVLGAVVLFVLGALLCFFLICCAPCCSADEKPLIVATQAEMDSKRNLKQPILENKNEKTDNTNSESAQRRTRKTLWEETVSVWKDFLESGITMNASEDDKSAYAAPRPSRRSSSRKKKRRSSRSSSERASSDPLAFTAGNEIV